VCWLARCCISKGAACRHLRLTSHSNWLAGWCASHLGR
jgi:hypothetical protein